jgi:hypothetical protein
MKAFISSTSKDLTDYRQASYEVCNRLQIVPIGMEQFESMGMGATQGSKAKLDDANVYVGIVANRYGYIEDGYDKSVTELEFDYVGTRGLDRLCFVADDAAKLPVYPENQDKLNAFKARIDKLIRNSFTTSWEFKYKLYDSLLKWMFRQKGGGPSRRSVWEPLFDDYARFGGRQDVLAQIKVFVDSPDPGYLVITAPAGFGKTALAARLVQLFREITAYHFFTGLYKSAADSEIFSEQFFLQNVVEQLKLWHPWTVQHGETPTTLAGWVAAYQDLLSRALDEKRILLIDGLDEVKTWDLSPYLRIGPPANLKIIVTVRDVGQDWLSEFRFPKNATKHLPLGGLNRSDVRQFLELSGPTAQEFANDDALLDRVITAAAAKPPMTGVDPLYLRCLANDIEGGRVNAGNIETQPKGLEEYLDDWWKTIVAEAEKDSSVLDLLGTLAAAVAPIPREDLVAVNPGLKGTWTKDPFQIALGNVRRTVAGSDAAGYWLAHPRFRDYMQRFNEVQLYREKLLEYCRNWANNRGGYSLMSAIQHFVAAKQDALVFSTILDNTFRTSQRDVLKSVQPTLADLRSAIELACKSDQSLVLLRCAATYRNIIQTGSLSETVFGAVDEGNFTAAIEASAVYGAGPKSNSAWLFVLRCYLIWEAVFAGEPNAVTELIAAFNRQFALAYQGVDLHTTRLCEALIARAAAQYPPLVSELGVDKDWRPQLGQNPTPVLDDATELSARLAELGVRMQNFRMNLDENPSLVQFIDEGDAGEFTVLSVDAMVQVASTVEGRSFIDQVLALVRGNPYPRYRDDALVAVGIAASAVSETAWTRKRLRDLIATGLDNEGITFTFDLAAQLAAEAKERGLAATEVSDYIDAAKGSNDRWGSALRAFNALAAAEFCQGRKAEAAALLESAASRDNGFAGYMATHLLVLACRWCEFDEPDRAYALGLLDRSRGHAKRVRDPQFRDERINLVDEFAKWFAEAPPSWPEVAARLRMTPDPDARRLYKDLASARWSAAGKWNDWHELVFAVLADGTALDLILGRLFGEVVRKHRSGIRPFPDSELVEALKICHELNKTNRPWEVGAPAFA